jgi:hypothetical protein
VDAWIFKLSSTGDIEWQECLGGSNNDWIVSLQQTSDGGYIMAGNTWSNEDGDIGHNHGNSDLWVVKIPP